MSFIPDLYEVQAGNEPSTDWGTAVAPTVKLMGITGFSVQPNEPQFQANDIRGSQAPGFMSAPQSRSGAASLEGILLYEDAPYMLDAAFGIVDSDQAGYSVDTDVYARSYEAPLATYDTDTSGSPRIFTIAGAEKSATTDAYSVSGATLTNFTVSGESGAPLQYTMNFIGKQAQQDELASLSDRTVNMVMGDHVALYIDPATDAVGTTEIENSFFTFNLNVNTNRELRFHMGALTPSGYRDAKWSGELRLTMELDATTKALYDAILNASTTFERVIRIKATSGTQYIQFDFNGVCMGTPEAWTDRDGVATVELVMSGQYNATLGNWLKAQSQCSVSALA